MVRGRGIYRPLTDEIDDRSSSPGYDREPYLAIAPVKPGDDDFDCAAPIRRLAMTLRKFYPSFNSVRRKSLTALRAASAVAGLPPTCGLSSMQASL